MKHAEDLISKKKIKTEQYI